MLIVIGLVLIAILAFALVRSSLFVLAPTASYTRVSTHGVIRAVDLSPNDELLAAGIQLAQQGAGPVAMIWQMNRLEDEPIELLGSSSGISIAFSPDNSVLAVGHENGTITLWRIADIAKAAPTHPLSTLSGPSGEVLALEFSPDSQTLFIVYPRNWTTKLLDLR